MYSKPSNSILLEAHALINGERREAYGEVQASFQRIADLATIVLNKEFSAEDCALFMICFKLAREMGKHKRDNLVDLCGYADLLQQMYDLDTECKEIMSGLGK